MTEGLASDHVVLEDGTLSRRYLAQMRAICAHLPRVLGVMEAEGALSARESAAVAGHLAALGFTFRALEMKYMMVGRAGLKGTGALTIDDHESGFPTAREVMVLANDAAQATARLAEMPSEAALKRQMLDEIIGDLRTPVRLQYALSQRLYLEELAKGRLFWPHVEAEAEWLGDVAPGRRRYLLHWSSWDSQVNLPLIWLMELEDTGATGLPADGARWAELRGYLSAQSLSGLKLLTIARGLDADFSDLHPKRLRRLHVGPMHSHLFTRQSGPIADVLAAAGGAEGEDWALAWTSELLESERVVQERTGWFGQVEREVFALDPVQGSERGVSARSRALVLPARPYQVLVEQAPEGFRRLRKYVVGDGGRVLSQR
ncbi:hypothetical protein KM176_09990 [Pseudooceanicola sp. CBS1P-1]|uniref:Uncharacterized protein n=1 Tax=Pseudooceanicola albus TaxID=2692189 RepID=A0A6L7G7T2_9RHOB|nr:MULTISPECIES: hypothetical protein [Pseudooceanicola]MBT9384189.1 hypothetical protein [Pseudooceanicola endophyticus]MXN19712.1 hypothetical protein [Pseudooceanicola albus]